MLLSSLCPQANNLLAYSLMEGSTLAPGNMAIFEHLLKSQEIQMLFVLLPTPTPSPAILVRSSVFLPTRVRPR